MRVRVRVVWLIVVGSFLGVCSPGQADAETKTTTAAATTAVPGGAQGNELQVLTFATDPQPGFCALALSARAKGHRLRVLGMREEVLGLSAEELAQHHSDCKKKGNSGSSVPCPSGYNDVIMLKLRTCSEAVRHIAAQAPRTLLLFLDAFDTLLVQPPEHTVAQYEALQNRLWDLGDSGSPGSSSSGSAGGGGDAGKQRSAAEEARDPVVFGAECNNNPVCLEGYPAADGPLRFLNSGTYMGRATAVATYLSRVAEELQAVRPLSASTAGSCRCCLVLLSSLMAKLIERGAHSAHSHKPHPTVSPSFSLCFRRLTVDVMSTWSLPQIDRNPSRCPVNRVAYGGATELQERWHCSTLPHPIGFNCNRNGPRQEICRNDQYAAARVFVDSHVNASRDRATASQPAVRDGRGDGEGVEASSGRTLDAGTTRAGAVLDSRANLFLSLWRCPHRPNPCGGFTLPWEPSRHLTVKNPSGEVKVQVPSFHNAQDPDFTGGGERVRARRRRLAQPGNHSHDGTLLSAAAAATTAGAAATGTRDFSCTTRPRRGCRVVPSSDSLPARTVRITHRSSSVFGTKRLRSKDRVRERCGPWTYRSSLRPLVRPCRSGYR